MEHERRPKGGDDDSEPGSPVGTRCSGRVEIDPGGPRRDPDGDPAGAAAGIAEVPGFHEHHRIDERRRPSGKQERGRRRDASMALRRPSSGMFEARKGFLRIDAYRQLSLLELALARHRGKSPVDAMEDAA